MYAVDTELYTSNEKTTLNNFISKIGSKFGRNLYDNKMDGFILASPRYIHTVIDNVDI